VISAIFKIMWLRLWRDKGALVLAFILPGFIFAIFAAIFSNASGGSLDLRVSMALTSNAPASVAFAEDLKSKANFSLTSETRWNEENIRGRVRLGQDDVGIIITGDMADPYSRPFLLFSAMQGAAISLDERKSGISDRLLIGPAGAASLLTGKFLFLTLIGTVQAAIIVAVAYIAFDVGVTPHLFALVLACIGSAALASSIALFVASLSGSSAQMNTVSTFVVLLFSAIGGSMVPRFMMPNWLQSLGQFTPNHWSIEAFYGILARGQTLIELLHVWMILYGGAALLLALAAIISHRLMRV